ncbi:MAG: prolyl oligopeptidase family serine peptidase [Anaerolineae bacterium]
MPRIESFLAARLFLSPQWVGDHLYFISNLSGRLSLYRMKAQGSVPQPLLPPDIALFTPELMGGDPYRVFPSLGLILVMLDQNGNEEYAPHVIPLDGGFPEPFLPDVFGGRRSHMSYSDGPGALAVFDSESLESAVTTVIRVNVATRTARTVAEATHSLGVSGVAHDVHRIAMVEQYTQGDCVLKIWTSEEGLRRLYGVPIDERSEGQVVPLTGFGHAAFTPDEEALLILTALFDDHFSIGRVALHAPDAIDPVPVVGLRHKGIGELDAIHALVDDRYWLLYNIDGASWLYETRYDAARRELHVTAVIVGEGSTADGVLAGEDYDAVHDRYAFAFSTATSPTQLYTWEQGALKQHTDEQVLAIPSDWLSKGEDASFISWDGLRISARLYLPAPTLGYEGPRPLVYYVHGGPQSQERPDFAWFSMPLIQFLNLNGFAVFVPNARGSTGYGLSYTKFVDRDWGGRDRLDHVHAMTAVLPQDSRIDSARAGVVGRSYGGYMTLTLAARHPELWKAAVDMFGPYNLFSFEEHIPETWKPYFHIALGDPEKDRDFLNERSPHTYIEQIACPLLVTQGRNDPRVVATESRQVVERLRALGKTVDYLEFENEGHDVLRLENRIRVYNAITDFFRQWLS